MRSAYRVPEQYETTNQLAEKILADILSSGVTYAEAADALEVAQEKLQKCTKPST